MNNSFSGKVAIVTGAGQGIGFEIAKQIVDQGGSVVLNDLSADLASAAAGALAGRGNCIALAGDSSSESHIQELIAAATQQFGKLDLIVANAGITLFDSFLAYEPANLRRVLEVNLVGTFLLVQAAARQMKLQGSGGRIVLMSSVTGNQAHRNLAAYGMSKAGIQMLAKNLVIELSPLKITINAVAPGATLTERTLETDPLYVQTWSHLTPMGRPGSTSDVANAVTFLLSDAAAHITGQTLVVDGGWSAVSPEPDLSQMR